MRIFFIHFLYLGPLIFLLVKCINKIPREIKKNNILMCDVLKKQRKLWRPWKIKSHKFNTFFLNNHDKMIYAFNRGIANGHNFVRAHHGGMRLFSTEKVGRTKIKELYNLETNNSEKKNYKICGWIKSVRTVGKSGFAFVDINDGSHYKNFQVVIDSGISNYQNVLKASRDDAIECFGELKCPIGKKQKVELSVYDLGKKHYIKLFKELNTDNVASNSSNASDSNIINANNDETCSTTYDNESMVVLEGENHEQSEKIEEEKSETGLKDVYMISKKYHTKEYLRNFPHLRGRTKLYSSIFRLKSDLIIETFNYFKKKNYTYINTPILTSNDCEGGGELFHVTTSPNKNKKAETGAENVDSINEKKLFFKKPCYLNVSSQLALECLCCSIGDVFTINQSFRAENSNTSRHLSEFLMLEIELAFSDLNNIILESENYIKEMINFVLHKSEDIEYINEHHDQNIKKNLEEILKKPFVIITYEEAIQILKKRNNSNGTNFDLSESDISFEDQKYLTNIYFKSPVVIINYPDSIKPFYMKLNDDKKTVSCMDVIFPNIGEIAGGSERETNLNILKEQMKKNKLNIDLYNPYLELRKYGNIPHSGFGLGIDRLIMYILSISNIRDIVPFPRYPNYLFM
ncbi:asparagine--tRNA ligase, putative [Plasmodium chabaudi chabaudi]|uniref:asparagine--tRNA ligase n=1 Tax=Plasmodium chabaudi chabaudi TaxID=31271 RepID=A0A1C6YJ85_PLACU|nr:asparagine--tRNA ligase, putative [Plasmodium chabaudi chabaudi]